MSSSINPRSSTADAGSVSAGGGRNEFLRTDPDAIREFIADAATHIGADRSELVQMNLSRLRERERVLVEALGEAIGWNWLDGDVPQEIQDKCCDPLLTERNKP